MNVELAEIISLMKEKISEEVEVEVAKIDADIEFKNLGLDSISSMFMINDLEEKYKIQLKALHLMEYPTIRTFAEFVKSLIDED